MSHKKMAGSIVLIAGFAAIVFAFYLFVFGSGNNNNLLNVILYLCCGASFFFWGINLLIPNRQITRKPLPEQLDPQN